MSDMIAGFYILPEDDKSCEKCRYRPLNWFDPPCVTCTCSNHWEAKEEEKQT